MAEVTRRTFLKQASAGAAAAGALVAVAGLPTVRAAAQSHAARPAEASSEGPLVAHVRDVASGEIAVLVGTREIVIHDRELVARLVKATL